MSKHDSPSFANSPKRHIYMKQHLEDVCWIDLSLNNQIPFPARLQFTQTCIFQFTIRKYVQNSPYTKCDSDKDANKNFPHCTCSKWHLCKAAHYHFCSCLWSASGTFSLFLPLLPNPCAELLAIFLHQPTLKIYTDFFIFYF